MTPRAGLPPGGHRRAPRSAGNATPGGPGPGTFHAARIRVPGDGTLSGTRCLAARLRTKRAADHDRRAGGGPPAAGGSRGPADVTIEVSAGRRMDARPAQRASGAGGSLHGPFGTDRKSIPSGGSAAERPSRARPDLRPAYIRLLTLAVAVAVAAARVGDALAAQPRVVGRDLLADRRATGRRARGPPTARRLSPRPSAVVADATAASSAARTRVTTAEQ